MSVVQLVTKDVMPVVIIVLNYISCAIDTSMFKLASNSSPKPNMTVHWYAFGNDLASFGLSGPTITITQAMLQAGDYTAGASLEFFVDFMDPKGVSSKATKGTLTIQ